MKKDSLLQSWRQILGRLDGESLILKLPFIFSGVAIGLLSVTFAHTAEFATEAFLEIFRRYPYLALLITPLGFVISRWIVLRFSSAAGGSGIPQVMAALELADKNPALVRRLLGIKILLTKIASNLVVLFGGGTTGREGPMVQIGASLFLVLGKRLRSFFPKLDDSTLIASGGAAGIAAAFNTPLGGIVFAIEELVGSHFSRMRSSMLIAVIIAGFVAQALVGPYLMFGNLSLTSPTYTIAAATLTISILMGLLGGVSSKIFMNGQTWVAAQTIRNKYIISAVLGLAVAILLVLTREEHIPGAGIPLIRDVLWKDVPLSPWVAAEKWLGMTLTFVSGIAGGFFAPTLTIGAIFGKSFSVWFVSQQAATLALIGMVSLLSSMTRAPFTALVLVSEMSNGHSVILPLMLASLIGLFVSQLVEKRSYYHFQTEFWLKQINPAPKVEPAEAVK
ncbi:MAG: chloride channel protein [Proteobacteria bacterium]|nr:MAG: chloride channel protein [Pseudomonadota bacterium]